MKVSGKHILRDSLFLFGALLSLGMSFIFCHSPAYSMSWNDANYYYSSGSRFALDDTQSVAVNSVISAGEKGVLAAKLYTDEELELGVGKVVSLPICDDGMFICDVYRATVTATSPYHTWDISPLEPSGEAINESGDNKNVLLSYGYTSYACQNLWLDRSGKMNCSQNWGEPIRTDYATMEAETVSGLQTHTYYIRCDGEWFFSYRYYKGCYVPSNQYPSVLVSSFPVGAFTSPAEFAEIQEQRSVVASAISSITASGFVGGTAGVSVTNLQNYYNYIVNGYTVVSSGTVGGTGTTGTTGDTSSSSDTINLTMTAPYEAGEWDTYASTATLYPILDDYYAQISTGIGPLIEFIDKFAFNLDTATVCSTSFTVTCSFGTVSFDLAGGETASAWTKIITIMKFFMKVFTLLFCLWLIVGA